jgi:hypothetical protein
MTIKQYIYDSIKSYRAALAGIDLGQHEGAQIARALYKKHELENFYLLLQEAELIYQQYYIYANRYPNFDTESIAEQPASPSGKIPGIALAIDFGDWAAAIYRLLFYEPANTTVRNYCFSKINTVNPDQISLESILVRFDALLSRDLEGLVNE